MQCGVCLCVWCSNVYVVFTVAGQCQRSRVVSGTAPTWTDDVFDFVLSQLPPSFSVSVFDKDRWGLGRALVSLLWRLHLGAS